MVVKQVHWLSPRPGNTVQGGQKKDEVAEERMNEHEKTSALSLTMVNIDGKF